MRARVLGNGKVDLEPWKLDAVITVLAFKAIDWVHGMSRSASSMYAAYGIADDDVVSLEIAVLKALDWTLPMALPDLDDSVHVIM